MNQNPNHNFKPTYQNLDKGLSFGGFAQAQLISFGLSFATAFFSADCSKEQELVLLSPS